MKKYYNLEIRKIISVTGLKTVENILLDKDFFFPTESHKFYEFVYVLKGDIYCQNNDTNFKLNTGEFKLILPNVSHRYFTNNEAQIFIICFSCKSNVLSVLDEPIFIENNEKKLIDKLLFETENAFELPFVERIILKENAPIGVQQITENIIEELLIRLLQTQMAGGSIQSIKSKVELQSTLVNEIVSILKEHIYDKITLPDICKNLFYSNTYLNGIFKVQKNTTIMKYYTRLKIDESKQLLLQGLSIQQISDKLCFDNSNYFTKTFKNTTGMTPSKYRQNKLKNLIR